MRLDSVQKGQTGTLVQRSDGSYGLPPTPQQPEVVSVVPQPVRVEVQPEKPNNWLKNFLGFVGVASIATLAGLVLLGRHATLKQLNGGITEFLKTNKLKPEAKGKALMAFNLFYNKTDTDKDRIPHATYAFDGVAYLEGENEKSEYHNKHQEVNEMRSELKKYYKDNDVFSVDFDPSNPEGKIIPKLSNYSKYLFRGLTIVDNSLRNLFNRGLASETSNNKSVAFYDGTTAQQRAKMAEHN